MSSFTQLSTVLREQTAVRTMGFEPSSFVYSVHDFAGCLLFVCVVGIRVNTYLPRWL